MGWKLDGTFERETNNTQETATGKLWEQDLDASIKIIAYRHDYHDRDLAQGIQECLNLNGLNAMLADLDMGGFKITNTVAATLVGDVPQYGQLVGSATFNEGLRELQLVDRNGANVGAPIVIPSGTGGGGEGTVTDITIGSGLTTDQNPIQTSANLSLEVIGTGQSYSGGIEGIVIDNHGRVTQVTTGASSSTNLTWSRTANIVTVKSDTGTDAAIQSANATGAGILTSADWNLIQSAVQKSDNITWTGQHDFNGNVSLLDVRTMLGNEVLPNILAKGMEVRADGDIYLLGLPTEAGTSGLLYDNGDGILRVS